jgi:hypothetical protein
MRSFVASHLPRNVAQPWRAGLQDAFDDLAGLVQLIPVVKDVSQKTLHDGQTCPWKPSFSGCVFANSLSGFEVFLSCPIS